MGSLKKSNNWLFEMNFEVREDFFFYEYILRWSLENLRSYDLMSSYGD